MKIKLFNSVTSLDDLENQIAEWTKDLNPKIHDIRLTAESLHDLYGGDHQTMAGKVCNSWIEYMASITYDLQTNV